MEVLTIDNPDDILKYLTKEQKLAIYEEIKKEKFREYSRQYYENNREKMKKAACDKYRKNSEVQVQLEGKRRPGRPRKEDI